MQTQGSSFLATLGFAAKSLWDFIHGYWPEAGIHPAAGFPRVEPKSAL